MTAVINVNVRTLSKIEQEILRMVDDDLTALGLQDTQNMLISIKKVTYYDSVKEIVFNFQPSNQLHITGNTDDDDVKLAEEIHNIVKVWLERHN